MSEKMEKYVQLRSLANKTKRYEVEERKIKRRKLRHSQKLHEKLSEKVMLDKITN